MVHHLLTPIQREIHLSLSLSLSLCQKMERLIILHTILIWIMRTVKEFSFKYMLFTNCTDSELETYTRSSQATDSRGTKKSDATRVYEDEKTTLMSGEDVEMILGGMDLCGGSEQLELVSSIECFSNLFEEEEPSFEELKESFSVFDRDGDGFIDEHELQAVLGKHGFADQQALELETCREMIRNYDRNQDGKIDFMEFVKLMEISFC